MNENISNKEIKEKYKESDYGLSGLSTFLEKLKRKGYEVDEERLTKLLENEEEVGQMKPSNAQSYFKINSPPKHYQIDTMYLNYTKTKYVVLVMIDILSRKAFLFPIKDNTLAEKIRVLSDFLNEGGEIYGVVGDDEFNKKTFIQFLQENDIDFNFDVANNDHLTKGNRLGIIDRFIRTLRRRILRYIIEKESLDYFKELDELLKGYNDTPHSSLYNKTPNDVYDSLTLTNIIMELNALHNEQVAELREELQVGDFVRIAKEKKPFQKEGAIFTQNIYKIQEKDGNKFIVSNERGEILSRRYKYNELQKMEPKVAEKKMKDGKKNIQILLEDEEKEKRILGKVKKYQEPNKEVLIPEMKKEDSRLPVKTAFEEREKRGRGLTEKMKESLAQQKTRRK